MVEFWPDEEGEELPGIADRQYWVTKEDPEEFANFALDRIETFQDSLRSGVLADRRERCIRYYYNDYYPEEWEPSGMEIRALGEEGEYAGLVANHFRNLLSHLHTLTTQNRPAWDTRAVNSENRSLQQARLGDNILEYYMTEKRVEVMLRRAAEHAIILGSGYILIEWAPNEGKVIEADPMTGQSYREGDIAISTPTIFDLAWEPGLRHWEQLDWFGVRQDFNKWDLAARFPEFEDEILAINEYDEGDRRESMRGSGNNGIPDSDLCSAWKIFHRPTDAIPDGRYALILPDGTVLLDTPYPYPRMTLQRMAGGEFISNCLGYTVAYDLLGPQEALNSELSAILTNHKSFGVQNVWSPGGTIRARQLEGGLNIVESPEKPEPLNLTYTPKEIFEFAQDMAEHMEYLSGINSVARGQPEASLKSGAALALIDSKAVQFASTLIQSYHLLLEDTGTALLQVLRRFADSERVVSIQGKHNRTYQHHFTGEDLDRIDRVAVTSGNALTRTLSGRVEVANHLLERGMFRVPEQYLNLIETGNLDVMLEGERSQLDLVREENETLMDGGTAFALGTDFHLLHIQEHQSLLNSTDIRTDEMKTQTVLSHMLQHIELLRDPAFLELQMALGFRVPPTAMAMFGLGPEGEPAADGAIGEPVPEDPEAPMPPGYSNNAGVEGPKMPSMPNDPRTGETYVA